ncbi:MAG: DUF2061 domain-containing protein [Candidatus Micrarchaeota archaeon]|nr:DUF2061 domain-containing protein [Candidatus Micrarchaeota archaeon]
MEKKAERHYFKEGWKRSLAKALTYRILIIILDFSIIYLFTGRVEIAFWFMVVSNVYTTIGYYAHERVWNKIRWGKDRK